MAVVTKELADLLTRVDAENFAAAARALGHVQEGGDKVVVETGSWGTLLMTPTLSTSALRNRAILSGEASVDDLDPLIEKFKAHGVRPTFHTCPVLHDAELVEALRDRGFGPNQFEALWYAEMKDDLAPIPLHIEIRRASNNNDFDDFLNCYLTGWDFPERMADIWREAFPHFREMPGFTFYTAYIDGAVAACAQLQLVESVGYFADAVTLPDFRRRGCQNAFFSARATDAKEQGATTLMCITDTATQSAHNMENFGLRTAFNIMFWQRAEET